MDRFRETRLKARLKPASQVRGVSLSGRGRGAASEADFLRLASRRASRRAPRPPFKTLLPLHSAKPSFFHDENRASLFQVEPQSGMLLNTDNGTPTPQVDTSLRLPLKSLDKVFQGGSAGHLHKLLSIESSSQVLYVGDHIYGDILRSKKVLGWRTMLVVPELEKEVELLWTLRDTRKQLQLLRNERDHIEDKIHHLQWSLRFGVNVVNKDEILAEMDKLQSQQELVRLTHQEAQLECHQKFHKVWGQLMKTGYQNSRFAHQVERFACLYTSQVSNLSLYSPDKYYRPGEVFGEEDIQSLQFVDRRSLNHYRYPSNL
ncbi:hypothetical protein OROGR_021363 [Orobanche gracilis]